MSQTPDHLQYTALTSAVRIIENETELCEASIQSETEKMRYAWQRLEVRLAELGRHHKVEILLNRDEVLGYDPEAQRCFLLREGAPKITDDWCLFDGNRAARGARRLVTAALQDLSPGEPAGGTADKKAEIVAADKPRLELEAQWDRLLEELRSSNVDRLEIGIFGGLNRLIYDRAASQDPCEALYLDVQRSRIPFKDWSGQTKVRFAEAGIRLLKMTRRYAQQIEDLSQPEEDEVRQATAALKDAIDGGSESPAEES